MEDLESAVMEIVGVDLQNTANSDSLTCLSVEEDTASSVAKESINQSGATPSFWRKSGLSKNLSWKSILL